ncbi:MAG: hypothetical protein JJT96_14475 [Opitutales bacterium]|nr:hypothetical protein [Opitutales bacterium]
MRKLSLGWIFFALIGVFCLVIAHDYGISYDEPIRWSGGDRKLGYYAHLFGFTDNPDAMQVRRDLYPGFFDLNLAWVRKLSPASDWGTGRVFNLFFGLLGVVATGLLAQQIRKGAGWWAGAFLLLYPGWFGHMFINPKDIPFATMYTFSLAALLHFLKKDDGRFLSRPLLLFSVVAGLTAATRVPGLIFFVYLAMVMVAGLLLRAEKDPGGPAIPPLSAWLREAGRGLLAVGIGFAVLLPWWPYLHSNPFGHTAAAIGSVTHFEWEFPVFFWGEYIPAQDLPFSYLPTWFLFTTPLALMVAALLGGFFALKTLRTMPTDNLRENIRENLPVIVGLFAIIFPVVFILVLNSTLYNGLRHVLFIIAPGIALIAAGWTAWWQKGWPSLKPLNARLAAGALLLAYAPVLATMVRLHPYQYTYFNELAGGVGNASHQFETEYWGTSYREGIGLLVDWLDAHNAEGDVIVNMEHPTWLVRHFIPRDRPYRIHLVRSQGEPAHFFIANTVWHTHTWWAGEVIATVEREGAVFCVVRDRRHLVGEQRAMFYGFED